jgi:hypothetical protein
MECPAHLRYLNDALRAAVEYGVSEFPAPMPRTASTLSATNWVSPKPRRGSRERTPGLAIYSHTVNARCPLSDTLESAFPWCAEWETELESRFRAYVEAKQRENVLDYDDLLLYWANMMEEPALARASATASTRSTSIRTPTPCRRRSWYTLRPMAAA